ncbi:MAG: 2-amino-4-hydroxy-6-hydroxymethyldihydropteridine diphosphokinase [Rhodocyclaceae bacterium]|nr:MAG: 2-amino-4-hydroxy-6-hydroxymethyldihydropteridine diphosphokinase [Rhodocyclaceae bacterium]
MTPAYVALGANLDDPVATVIAALEALKNLSHSRLVATSSLYRTAPVGLKDQPDFINAVAALETELTPAALLEELFAIEARFGRRRSVRNAPRTLDLDLLLHGNTRSDHPAITLPHPRMHERAFVLAPLAEIAPDLAIPGQGEVKQLLSACASQAISRLPAATGNP